MQFFRHGMDYDSDGDEAPGQEKTSAKDENYYLNMDDIDIIEWDVKVVWMDPYHLYENVDKESAKQKFKGGDWSTLVRLNRHGLWVYVGLNFQDTLPPDYSLHYQYTFSLKINNAASDGGDSDEAETKYEHLFSGVHENTIRRQNFSPIEEYTDIGSRNAVYTADMLHYNHNQIVDADGFMTIHCKMKAIPKPVVYSFRRDCKAATGMVGLENLGATCYLNALLQMLFHVNAFRQAVFQTPFENENLSNSTMLALQSTFYQLQTSNIAVSTNRLTKAFGWNRQEIFEQQDVQEMLRVLLDKLEEGMKGKGTVDGAIKRIFAGTVKSFIRCTHVCYESSRLEEFYDIQLDVKGCKNIYESLRQYCAMEVLSKANENQYDAGEEHGKQDAEKGVVFTRLPPVLTMHLKRFEFDMTFSKIHDEYQFPARLDLDEFVEEKAVGVGVGVSNTYILHSVLVHSGDVYGGHYYAHIRPSTSESARGTDGGFWSRVSQSSADGRDDSFMNSLSKGGEWFQFDDESVNAIDRRHAVEGNYGSRCDVHSAYMLVYLREAEAGHIMGPVEPPLALVDTLEQVYSAYGGGFGGLLGGYLGGLGGVTERRGGVVMHNRGEGKVSNYQFGSLDSDNGM